LTPTSNPFYITTVTHTLCRLLFCHFYATDTG